MIMTRDEVIKIVGSEYVEQAEHESCQYSGIDGDYTVFTAVSDYNDNLDRVIVYYYQPTELVLATEDLGSLDWKIHRYDVV